MNLVTLAKSGEKLCEEFVKVLIDHFSVKQLEIVERFKFYSHSRKPGENILSYVTKFCVLVEHCKFIGILDAMIRKG